MSDMPDEIWAVMNITVNRVEQIGMYVQSKPENFEKATKYTRADAVETVSVGEWIEKAPECGDYNEASRGRRVGRNEMLRDLLSRYKGKTIRLED